MGNPFRGYDQWKTASPYDEEGPCEICGKSAGYDCKCIECPICGEAGRVECLVEHKLADPTVAGSIVALGDSLIGEECTPRWLYRAIYKGVDCGPSIGMLIDGQWVYCDDLDNGLTLRQQRPMGISVSSIVEGSDVDVEGEKWEEPFTLEEFWKLVERVNDEAVFYWERDNHRNFVVRHIKTKVEYYVKWGYNSEFEGGDFPPDLKAHLEETLDEIKFIRYDNTYIPIPGFEEYEIVEWINDDYYC